MVHLTVRDWVDHVRGKRAVPGVIEFIHAFEVTVFAVGRSLTGPATGPLVYDLRSGR